MGCNGAEKLTLIKVGTTQSIVFGGWSFIQWVLNKQFSALEISYYPQTTDYDRTTSVQ